jgi:hypothetical protein
MKFFAESPLRPPKIKKRSKSGPNVFKSKNFLAESLVKRFEFQQAPYLAIINTAIKIMLR